MEPIEARDLRHLGCQLMQILGGFPLDGRHHSPHAAVPIYCTSRSERTQPEMRRLNPRL